MSDPMTNVEIEDVLSSIRRLVSESAAEPARAVAQETPHRAPKLVLTPALRVNAAETPDDDLIEPSAEDEQKTNSEPVVLGNEQRVDAAFSKLNLQTPQRFSGESFTLDRANLLSTIAELEAAVRDQPDDWEPDGTGTDTELSWARAGFRGDVEVEDAEEIQIDPIAALDSESAQAPADASAWPDTLSEAARRYGTASDSDEQQDDDDFEPIAQFHHRSTASSKPQDDAEHYDDLIGGPDLGEDPEDMLESYLDGAPIIDPAQLQDMVRQIVREELQGKLGERITRNVRKLVRREIHRVLTTQDFD